MAYSGLFQAFSAFSRSSLGNGRDADEGDIGLVALQFGEAFGQDADGGEVVFLELVGQCAEAPAEHLHVGGGEGEREFLRRQIFIVLSIRPQGRSPGRRY